MQRCENLVDLEKRSKMSIWTQKSALIQLRTSLLKFDDLAEKSEKSSVSNFSTKVSALTPKVEQCRGGFTAQAVATALFGLQRLGDTVEFYDAQRESDPSLQNC